MARGQGARLGTAFRGSALYLKSMPPLVPWVGGPGSSGANKSPTCLVLHINGINTENCEVSLGLNGPRKQEHSHIQFGIPTILKGVLLSMPEHEAENLMTLYPLSFLWEEAHSKKQLRPLFANYPCKRYHQKSTIHFIVLLESLNFYSVIRA